MKAFSFFVLFILITCDLSGQAITGRVVDEETNEPLPLANVYLNNSTIGTTTNKNGTFELGGLPNGSIELVASFVGYISFRQSITMTNNLATELVIRLATDKMYLGEVEVKAKKDRHWEALYERFEKEFLGETINARYCKIVNPWVIDVKIDSGTLIARARAPIQIENKALGYNVDFELITFKTTGRTYKIYGNSFYREAKAEKRNDKRRWENVRARAYESSPQHLFLSLINKNPNKEGYNLYEQIPGTEFMEKGRGFYRDEINASVKELKPGEIVVEKRNNNEVIQLPKILEVHYTKALGKDHYYYDLPFQVSWVVCEKEELVATKNGFPINPGDVSYFGYFSELRIADLLPVNYAPED